MLKTIISTFIVAAVILSRMIFSEVKSEQGSLFKNYQWDDELSLPPETPEVVLGDRLFFETRFSQYFFSNYKGDVNASLDSGDPILNEVSVLGILTLPNPFRGQSINCRNCHLGDDFFYTQPLAQRTYCDFSRRSSVPVRKDGMVRTVRNSPITINLGLPREVPLLLHYDGEFASVEELVIDTITGRKFGWLPEENAVAVAHIAKVIRDDKGLNPRNFRDDRGVGIPYPLALNGSDLTLSKHLQVPSQYRLDVKSASDKQVLYAIAKLIDAYMNSLRFGTKNTRRNSGSPYDLFLQKNGFPTWPEKGESNSDYTDRLIKLIERQESFRWITSKDDQFQLHLQSYEFGPSELQGLKIFFNRSAAGTKTHVGNCVACHVPPQFTDYRFHNNGTAQSQYDAIFGQGAFSKLEVPDLSTRNANFDAFLPVSLKHPSATGRFRATPVAGLPGYADLGAWNIFANPDLPMPQAALTEVVCGTFEIGSNDCTPAKVLPLTIGIFKTPSIRDPGHSYPYFHSGSVDTIEDVIRFYISTSQLARSGKIRNASPKLGDININSDDIVPLSAFLRSLNEDYH